MLNHQGTKELETERLILRRYTIDDAEVMYKNWACEDKVTEYLTWPTHSSVEVTEAVLADWVGRYKNPGYYHWGIVIKETGKLIGDIAVVHIDEKTEAATLGYCMGSKWWGRGIMPEAGKAVSGYLFEEIGFNRIAAEHDRNNPKSGRVMQKMGMQYEGTLRAAGYCNRGIIDKVCYSILKDEYNG